MAEEKSSTAKLNEDSILADILHDTSGNDLLTITTSLTVDDFSDSKNKIIYKTILDMDKKGVKATPTTLTTELENLKVLDQSGGYAYIAYLMNSFTSMAPVSNYINNVRDQSLLGNFISTLSTIVTDAQTKSIDDISSFVEKAEQDILAVTKTRRVADVIGMNQVADSIVNKLVAQSEDFRLNGRRLNGVTGVETGYAYLDQLTKGWKKQEMIIIGARPSVGKTAFAINLLYNIAKKGTPVVFFSLEMNAVSIGLRLLEKTAGLSDTEINNMEYLKGSSKDQILINAKNDLDKANATKLVRGMQEINKLPFYIDDTPNGQMSSIAAKCKKLKNLIPNLGLVAIDYLGLITSPSKANSSSRQQEVSDISRQIKELARTLDLPIIALSQLSRDTEKRDDHKPQLSDIRDSGAIEQDADMILMLYRKDYYSHQGTDDEKLKVDNNNPISQVDVALLKNRNGRIGDLQFSFDKEHCSFNIIDPDSQEPLS
ncbi:MAG: replicative DNA helicase [Bacilli bacterium]